MDKEVRGYISVLPEEIAKFNQKFKGENQDEVVKFPKELGAKHPFEFDEIETTYKKYGPVAATVNKYADEVVGDFSIELENPNAQKIIDDFLHDTSFINVIRTWVREGVLKGNGFLEIDLENSKIRVLNANYMYVKRKKNGEIIEYNQYVYALNKFNTSKNRLPITFTPNQIAHLPINKIPGDPYGIGYIYPAENIIENLVGSEVGKHKLIKRKAGAPVIVTLGQPGQSVQQADVDEFKKKLQYMTNSTEWVIDGNTKMEVLNFSDIGKNYSDSINQDFRMFCAATETPEVLFGSGQLNEGIAKVQLESRKMKIKSIQILVADIIEEKIIRPILRNNGFDERPNFIFNNPSEESINQRITQIQGLMGLMSLSPQMRAGLEIELAKIMNIKDMENVLVKPTKLMKSDEEKKAEENIPQPEVPGAKKTAKESIRVNLTESECEAMTLKEWINLKEIAGFNYSDYLVRILKNLRTDNFDMLRALNQADLENGLLSDIDIRKLKAIIKDGFKNNKTIREIQKDIQGAIKFKDRLSEDGSIALVASARPNIIARTETVRIANVALVDIFKENNIKEVRFLSALSTRTCETCESLNGRVFNINELNIGESQPPIHSNCRCSLISII